MADPLSPQCALCGFDFRDDRVTGADASPFARAYSVGKRGWWRMSEWVWFAGGGRLKHLALMRASAASRRYALLTTLLLAAGIGLTEGTRVGWRWVTDSPTVEPTGSVKPAGGGWIRVAGVPRPLPADWAPAEPVDLWWNFPQAVVAVIAAGLTGWLGMGLVMTLVRAGIKGALTATYRGEGRMTAAIHYGTAWWVPILLAVAVLGLRPVSFIGTIAGWGFCPPAQSYLVAAAVPAGFGLVMWWIWLWRLGATLPERTRARVMAFLVIGAPLIVAAVAGAWWTALPRLYDPVFRAMNVRF